MKFGIVIQHDRKSIRLQIERLTVTKVMEQYKVLARNQSFILQSNRPLIRAKGLKHYPITWKVVEGGYYHSGIIEKITKEIEKKI